MHEKFITYNVDTLIGCLVRVLAWGLTPRQHHATPGLTNQTPEITA